MILKSILKNLERFLSSLNFCKKSTKHIERDIALPEDIIDSERIVRSIFTPKNISKSKGTILPNTFRTPGGKDELSVNRLDYTTADYCKNLSRKIEQPEYKKSYFGLAVLRQKKLEVQNQM